MEFVIFLIGFFFDFMKFRCIQIWVFIFFIVLRLFRLMFSLLVQFMIVFKLVFGFSIMFLLMLMFLCFVIIKFLQDVFILGVLGFVIFFQYRIICFWFCDDCEELLIVIDYIKMSFFYVIVYVYFVFFCFGFFFIFVLFLKVFLMFEICI